jgi:hypothetical protein
MSVEALLNRLDRVRQSGSGRWMARCPGHDDRSASLSIRELPDGRILLHDFAGCGAADVLSALGIEFSDLFPPRQQVDHRVVGPRYRPSFDAVAAMHALAHEAAVVALIAEELAAVMPRSNDRLLEAAAKIHKALEFIGEPRRVSRKVAA